MSRITSLFLASAIVLATVTSASCQRKAQDGQAPRGDYRYRRGRPRFCNPGRVRGRNQGDGKPVKYGVQVIALGDGKFRAAGYLGGLPGDGWDEKNRNEVDGQTQDGVTTLFPT